MKALQSILVAVDFTPSCRAALREAALRASFDGAALTAVHVMDDFLISELKKALSLDPASIVGEWRQRLEKFVAETEVGFPAIKCEVRIGHPFAELVQSCRIHAADLLVMGAKGSRDEPHRIGTIAAKCIRKAPVDVLVVRDDAQGPFGRILACVDMSENSGKAVRAAFHFAQQDQASVDCLHVYQSAVAMSLDYGGLMPSPVASFDPEACKHWQSQLEAFIEPYQALAPELKVQSIVIERMNIRETILEHIEKSGATLVVIGTRGKSGLREMLIGTTAEKIIQHAPCSILAIKPDDFIASAD